MLKFSCLTNLLKVSEVIQPEVGIQIEILYYRIQTKVPVFQVPLFTVTGLCAVRTSVQLSNKALGKTVI